MGADPLIAGAQGAAVAPALAEATRILIAEDNEVGLELICMMARRLGVQVDTAQDGHQAVQKVAMAAAAGQPYTLVLMDFMMPVVDGIEATRRLRRAGHSIEQLPVIALTAVAEPREIGRFSEAGGQAYLAKPLTIAGLSAAFEAWLPDRAKAIPTNQPIAGETLFARFVERKLETLARIDTVLALGQISAAEIAEIREHLHKLAGTAGLFGDEDLSLMAAACEQDLIASADTEPLAALARHRPALGGAT